MNRVLKYLRRTACREEPDGVLLGRFLTRRDEAAFEELVRRHGPMVLGVCRRVLGRSEFTDVDADAADAFQATFLVLVRHGTSIVPRSQLGPWLHGVARRTALKARSSAARRRRAEGEAAQRQGEKVEHPTGGLLRLDLREILDEELVLLPEKYRRPLHLCFLEGKSRAEAARLLGWSEGTLSGRLARAKELLGNRLLKRGVTLGVAGAALGLVPPSLTAATVQAAGSLVAPAALPACGSPVAATALALTEEVLMSMFRSKVKSALGVILLVAALGVGAGISVGAWGSGDQAPQPVAQAPQPAPPAVRPAPPPPAPAQPAAQPPRKANEYVIEPPDILNVDYTLAYDKGPKDFSLQCLVRPDGTIHLGEFGTVTVNGLTVDQTRAAVARQILTQQKGFDTRSVKVEVTAFNSKVYYVIGEGADGMEQVARFPLTGNETVLDALVGLKFPLVGLGKADITVGRPTEGAKGLQILRVNWHAITQLGDTSTNYRLMPGDRLSIRKPEAKKADAGGAKDAAPMEGVKELELGVKALRNARSREEQRKAVELIEATLNRVREQVK